ncbi:MAG TPA: 30S ribosomal protein S18 [Candidatus Dojkabacteria bacterium]|mgnify:CR=1 FL=1|jgi:small subunit ribosomal protein S18|nr:30S ribosomal protein S18 [Candidatus Dojkabacteria bacterium]
MALKRTKKKKIKALPKLPDPFKGNPELINYKDVYKLKKFVTTRGRLIHPQRTGVSPKCQRKLAAEVKKARFMALLPYNELI